jgi:hypothetical protein
METKLETISVMIMQSFLSKHSVNFLPSIDERKRLIRASINIAQELILQIKEDEKNRMV